MIFVCVVPYSYESPNFAEVVWGRPEKGLLGRWPMAILTALKRQADKVFFGGGWVLQKGLMQGYSEVSVEYDFVLMRLGKLFTSPDFEGYSSSEIRGILTNPSIAVVDDNPKNENTEAITRWFWTAFDKEDQNHNHNRNTVIVVSDGANLPRVLNDADKAFDGLAPRVRIEGVKSDVLYDGRSGGCFVFEPPLLDAVGGMEGIGSFIKDRKQEANKAKIGQIGWADKS